MSRKIKPMGDVMLRLEKVLEEMMEDHDLQWYEALSLVHSYLVVHYPNNQEEYEDGSNPVFYYGHRDKLRG